MQFYSYIYKISFQFPLFTVSVLSLLSNMHTYDYIVSKRKSAYSWAPINQRPYVTTPDTLSSYKIWNNLIESQSKAKKPEKSRREEVNPSSFPKYLCDLRGVTHLSEPQLPLKNEGAGAEEARVTFKVLIVSGQWIGNNLISSFDYRVIIMRPKEPVK